MKRLTLALVLMTTLGWAAAGEPADDAWIAGLEGGWYGEDNMTPMGKMPFAMLFDWQEDGSLYTHSALNRETYIALRFLEDEEGRWILEETGGMEGLGVQSHKLMPVEAPGEVRRWVHLEDPNYLTIDMTAAEDRITMLVTLRGREHVRYDLARLPDEELPEMRRHFAEARERDPQEASIHDLGKSTGVPTGIAEARAAVKRDPENGEARLRLGQAIGEVLQEDPAQGATYAAEMLDSLRTAIDLDPTLVDAYHWLAGYYLNAPTIAGGSIASAEETAKRLAEVDPESGRQLLAHIEEQKRGTTAAH